MGVLLFKYEYFNQVSIIYQGRQKPIVYFHMITVIAESEISIYMIFLDKDFVIIFCYC